MSETDTTPTTTTTATPEVAGGVADVSVKRLARVCPTCGVVYAVPAELLIAIAGRAGDVFCPNGHGSRVDDASINERDVMALCLRTLASLRRRDAELARVTLQLAGQQTHAGAAAIDAAESKRRVTVIVRRAKSDDGATLVCPFCDGGYFGTARLRRHLKYAHVDQIKALPVSYFD